MKPSSTRSISSIQTDRVPLDQSVSKSKAQSRTRFRSMDAGNTLRKASNLGALTQRRVLQQSVGGSDRNDYWEFNLAETREFNLTLKGLTSNANVQVFDSNGIAIAGSYRNRNAMETVRCTVEAGNYYVRVYGQRTTTNYTLNLFTNATTEPLADTGAPTPVGDGTPADWTVLVYMAADNLEKYSVQDFQEMAAIGSDANINIVVQLDRTAADHDDFVDGSRKDDVSFGNWTDTRRGLITQGSTPGRYWGTSIGEANMGDANALQDFVTWGTNTYKADHYGLILWGHGSGLGVAVDDLTGDRISAKELNTVLSGLAQPLDLVGSDACLMGTLEFAYAIRNTASVYVASEENIPSTGWNYTSIFQDLKTTPTMTAEQWGGAIVSRYSQTYPDDGETLSAINLKALRDNTPTNLSAAINQFASTVINTGTYQDLAKLGDTRDRYAGRFGDGLFPDYCDIGNLFTGIANNPALSQNIRTAAQTVLNAYQTTVLQNFSAVPGKGTGLSIYAAVWGLPLESQYSEANLSFLAETQWNELLNALA